MKLPAATSKLTIFDPFNYNSSESDQTESCRGDSELDCDDTYSELETVITAALVENQKRGFFEEESLRDEELYIPAHTNYLSARDSYSLSYIRIGEGGSTRKNKSSYIQPLAAYFSEPYLRAKYTQDYVTALSYTSREAITENNSLLGASEDPLNDTPQTAQLFSNTRSVSIPVIPDILLNRDYMYL